MKLKYFICCGLDVHKNVIVATIVTTNSNRIFEYNQKSFSTINSDIQRFHDWLIGNNCYHVCVESTGKYWIPIFNYLENDIEVFLIYPKCQRQEDRQKGFQMDCQPFQIWPCHMLLHPSKRFPPASGTSQMPFQASLYKIFKEKPHPKLHDYFQCRHR